VRIAGRSGQAGALDQKGQEKCRSSLLRHEPFGHDERLSGRSSAARTTTGFNYLGGPGCMDASADPSMTSVPIGSPKRFRWVITNSSILFSMLMPSGSGITRRI
jgi:hypothetical protein